MNWRIYFVIALFVVATIACNNSDGTVITNDNPSDVWDTNPSPRWNQP